MKTTGERNEFETEPNDNRLHDLFLDQLADIYNAEKQLTQALPKLAEAARSPELRSAFEAHLEETKNHVKRLEKVFESLGEPLNAKTCRAMEGLLEEGDEILSENEDSPALDAALILAAQKVEHYEIATYGGLRAWAQRMGYDEAERLLNETSLEEKAADEKLTDIAEEIANAQAEEM